MKAYSTSLI